MSIFEGYLPQGMALCGTVNALHDVVPVAFRASGSVENGPILSTVVQWL